MRDRRAHSVLFGFDFQVNAAIVLMLENIKELNSLRLEGNEEDIELTLEGNRKILVQAKSVENASSDFSNVRANLKKALMTLSEGAQKVDAKQLIFITNSPNPFNDQYSRIIFWGPTRRPFSTLPSSAQEIVIGYLNTIAVPLDPQKFTVQVFPFETDDETERYKAVIQATNDFIGSLNANTSPGLGKKLLQVWHNNIFINGSKKDATIQLNKKNIICPLSFWKQIYLGAKKALLNNLMPEYMTKLFICMAKQLTPAVSELISLHGYFTTTTNFRVAKNLWINA